MKWQNTAILVGGACLLFGFGFYCVPTEQKADTFVKCTNAVTEIFSMRLWFALAVIFGFTTAVFAFLYRGARQDLKRLEKKHEELFDKMIAKQGD